MSERTPERLFIGAGNPWRGDDGVGPWLADALTAAGRAATAHPGDGAALIELMRGRASVVLIDATRSGRPAGTVTWLDACGDRVPAGLFCSSSHQFGVAEGVETARALGFLPRDLLLCGIEGRDFAPRRGLSPPVAAAADWLLPRLAALP